MGFLFMLNKFIFYSLCSLIIWLPIPLGSNRPWAWVISELIVFALFFLHCIFNIYKNNGFFPPLRTWPIFTLIGTLLLTLLIQIIFSYSTDPIQTKIVLLKTASFFMFAWLICVYTIDKKRITTIIYALIIAGLFQAIYATFLNLSPPSYTPIFGFQYSQRANGSFVYHNHLANYLAIILSIGIGFIISELDIKKNSNSKLTHYFRGFIKALLSKKLVIRLCLIIIVVALLLTRSRMGNIAFLVSLASVSLFALKFYESKPWSLKYLIISFFVLDTIIVGSLFGADKLQERLAETSFIEETRDEVIQDSIPLVKQYYLSGSGGGSYYGLFPTKQSIPYSGFYDHAHNEYVQFAIEFGVLSCFLSFFSLLYILYICFKNMTQRTSPLYQGVSFGVATAITFMILHIIVDFPLQATANAMTFIVIICLGLLSSKKRLAKN